MFKISAVICFLAVGELNMDLCFKSEVPLTFRVKDDCIIEMNKLIDYMDADLKERETSILFACFKDKIENIIET